MANPTANADAKIERIRESGEDFTTHRTGRIADVDRDGRALVTFPGSHGVAVRARSTVTQPLAAGERPEDQIGLEVLLVFEEGDPNRPVVVGILGDRLRPESRPPEVSLDLAGERDVVVDGCRVVFDAQREIVLRCGRSQIVLREDGKVVVRGTHLVSRATGPNKIKGGSISLN